ncbi:MAG: SagB/ThcOx family dehydrogenase [Gemmatimonadota bacterium]|nr:MAG: SagB/ThcOx family dehydrogenase [Gemmatimonadota bacterium]
MIQGEGGRVIALPDPRTDSDMSVEAALRERHSVRDYSDEPLRLGEISQVLWAAQGVTHGYGRTAPSAGALFPLELYVVAVRVDGLEPGLYKYRIGDHELLEVTRENVHSDLVDAALSQDCVADAAAVIVIGAVVERTAVKYGGRAERYVHMEVGAVAENVCLQAAALGLGTVYVGAFNDKRVKQVLGMPREEAPFALFPVGRPRGP